MSKHTPGPWIIAEHGTKLTATHPLRKHQYDIVTVHYAFERGQHEANAKLIAAAPDMAEALRGMVTLHEQRELVRGTSYDDVRVEVARAALAKAGLS